MRVNVGIELGGKLLTVKNKVIYIKVSKDTVQGKASDCILNESDIVESKFPLNIKSCLLIVIAQNNVIGTFKVS